MVDPSADLVVTRRLTIPASELTWRFSGSGGPGGQHANTSNTKVMLTWKLAISEALDDNQRARLSEALGPVVRIVAVEERSQTRNRELALERLRDRCEPRSRSKPRDERRRRPSHRSRRRLEEKRLRSERKAERRVVPEPDA